MECNLHLSHSFPPVPHTLVALCPLALDPLGERESPVPLVFAALFALALGPHGVRDLHAQLALVALLALAHDLRGVRDLHTERALDVRGLPLVFVLVSVPGCSGFSVLAFC